METIMLTTPHILYQHSFMKRINEKVYELYFEISLAYLDFPTVDFPCFITLDVDKDIEPIVKSEKVSVTLSHFIAVQL